MFLQHWLLYESVVESFRIIGMALEGFATAVRYAMPFGMIRIIDPDPRHAPALLIRAQGWKPRG